MYNFLEGTLGVFALIGMVTVAVGTAMFIVNVMNSNHRE